MCRLALLLPGLLLALVLLVATRSDSASPRPGNWASTQQLSAPVERPPAQNWATPRRGF
ncbi:hypothetical protein [Siccirubricoccus phaeus]|uniref:hypothetical protein n=1 Tax=Siccirubricoccus phaeus TaxID=2595053 RepID=UPI00165CA3A3|nr:hypothetical protein [Siccirubricoccus phaeus]